MDIWAILSELIVKGLSPEFRKMCAKLLDDWGKTAATTKSPFDDVVVSILKALLGL